MANSSHFQDTVLQDSIESDDTATMNSAQPEVHLQTPDHDELLNVIDTLRAQGINRYIDLPQLIVCGDQSAGKSSVLEAISGGLRFPTNDTLCTRFAIELYLRRAPDSHVHFTIIPYEDRLQDEGRPQKKVRPQEERDKLANFRPPTTSLASFPEIIDAAAEAMGVDGIRKSFSKDVLRVELSGPTQPHLTLVDLPGLFHTNDENQTEEDPEAIHELVKSYMEKSRSIILTVVSANNDFSNQIVTRYARKADPQVGRTLGIITKPDTLRTNNPNMEKYYKSLVRDDGGRFKLGWHLLKNRNFDTRDFTTAQRDKAEEDFFQQGGWESLDRGRVGIKSLKTRLSKILGSHIAAELPKLFNEIEAEVAKCELRLKGLGNPRSTVAQQQNYLISASQRFSNLMQASVDGVYLDPFFGSPDTDKDCSKRLRAVVQVIMKHFAQEMRLRGHTLELVDKELGIEATEDTVPRKTSREEFLEYVGVRMGRDRGRELPGTFNPNIIGALFREQSRCWEGIIHYIRGELLQATETAITLILEHVADQRTAHAVQLYLIEPSMKKVSKGLLEKVDEVLKPHKSGYPLTFNHYFIENIQKKRRNETRKMVAKKLHAFFGTDLDDNDDRNKMFNGQFNVGTLLDTLVQETEVDSDRFACIEATNAMEAYYKVALKTVIDTFGMYAMEAALLDKLPGIFSPKTVSELDEEMVSKLAAEPEDITLERQELQQKVVVLRKSLKTLQYLKDKMTSDRHPQQTKPPGNANVQTGDSQSQSQ